MTEAAKKQGATGATAPHTGSRTSRATSGAAKAAPAKATPAKKAPAAKAPAKAAPAKKAPAAKAAPAKAAPAKAAPVRAVAASAAPTAASASSTSSSANEAAATRTRRARRATEPAGRPGAVGPVLDSVERWTGLTLGLAEVVTHYSQNTLAAAEAEAGAGAEGVATADLLRVVPGAAAALGMRIQRRAFDAVAAAEQAFGRALGRAGALQLTSPVAQHLHERLSALDEEFKGSQQERAGVASTFLAAAGPQTLDELLARIDIEALMDRIDFEAVLDRIDFDAVLDRIDLDAVLDRVDLDSVVARVDLNKALEGVDVERLLERVDVNQLASGVLQEIEVTGLLRDSTGALANQTVGALRSQMEGMAKRITRGPVQP